VGAAGALFELVDEGFGADRSAKRLCTTQARGLPGVFPGRDEGG
jgi:hypothetical protein